MRSKHYDKYIMNLLQGVVIVSIGIFFAFYSRISGVEKQDWYLWAAGIAIVFNLGLFFIGSAFVHKVKADFLRRQKQQKEEFHDYTIEQ